MVAILLLLVIKTKDYWLIREFEHGFSARSCFERHKEKQKDR